MPIVQYHLTLPQNVYSGQNSTEKVLDILKDAQHVCVFCDAGVTNAGVADAILKRITDSGKELTVITDLPIEPTINQAEELIGQFKTKHADMLVGIGGGSTLDIVKLASVLATDEYSIRDMAERPEIARKKVPTLMIPTTAGTGAETTPNAILLFPEQNQKVGIVSNEMVADYVVLDAALMVKLPQKVIAASGIDAMAHAIECFTSKKANDFSDMFALEAFDLIIKNLEKAYQHDMDALEAMLNASFYAGIAITASGTNGVHALAYPLGGRYHIAHGIGNAIMLMPVMRFNQPAIMPMLVRAYDRCQPGGGAKSEKEKSDWVIEKMGEIIKNIGIPDSLKSFGIDKSDIPELVAGAQKITRLLVNNMQEITLEDMKKIYEQVL